MASARAAEQAGVFLGRMLELSARALSMRTTASSIVFCGARPSEASVTSAAASRRAERNRHDQVELRRRRNGVERREITLSARLVASHCQRRRSALSQWASQCPTA
jgi:hypothetical protein